MLAAEVLHRQPRIGLPQEAHDLGFREPLLHRPSLSLGRTLNRNATQKWGDVTGRLTSSQSQLPTPKRQNRRLIPRFGGWESEGWGWRSLFTADLALLTWAVGIVAASRGGA